jgi:NAD(P)-dependent dehydrogenase (short-subunit alcohol dehydrogenase family)
MRSPRSLLIAWQDANILAAAPFLQQRRFTLESMEGTMDSLFRGANVLVTGASRGLGRALAVALAKAGARVVLVARASAELDAAVATIRDAGGEAHALAADMGDKHAIHTIAGAAQALTGPIDLLFHNASTLGPTPLPLLLDTECEDFERVLAVNLVGPFRLTRAVAGAMALRGRGLIVHITSDAATNAYPRWGAYGVSKAALEHLSRSWAAELGPLGVTFLTLDPGEMDTAMHAAALPEASPETLARPETVAQKILSLLAAQRFTPGERIAVAEVQA